MPGFVQFKMEAIPVGRLFDRDDDPRTGIDDIDHCSEVRALGDSPCAVI